MRVERSYAKLEWITADPERQIEQAGRTCYRSEGKIGTDTARPFIRMIRGRGHESVLEHASASFRIVCDRGVSHEIVQHRLASYSQESMRFCNYAAERFGREITVIEPPGLSNGPAYRAWWDACAIAGDAYFAMLARGCRRRLRGRSCRRVSRPSWL